MVDHYKSVGPPHYEFILQPNPIFPLQIQFTSIAPYITGYCCWLPDFETKFFLKDCCQYIIGKPQFQFPTHVFEGGAGATQATKCKWSLLLSAVYKPQDILLPYSSSHKRQKKKNSKVAPFKKVLLLFNSVLVPWSPNFLIYIHKMQQNSAAMAVHSQSSLGSIQCEGVKHNCMILFIKMFSSPTFYKSITY